MSDLDRATDVELDTCAVSDALIAGGCEGVAVGLRAVSTPGRVLGRAVTIQLGPVDSAPSGRHLGTAAIEAARPGDVIVVAGGRDDTAGWGGLLSRAAKARGVIAVVVDGCVRDVDESRQLGLAVYARGTTPRTARGRLTEISWNSPVVVGGVEVAPGDTVIADGSGVVFVPAGIADEVLARACTLSDRERLMADRIDAGEAISQVMSADYEQMLTQRKRAQA